MAEKDDLVASLDHMSVAIARAVDDLVEDVKPGDMVNRASDHPAIARLPRRVEKLVNPCTHMATVTADQLRGERHGA